MSASPDVEHSNGLPPASDQSLPSFTPIRDPSRSSDKAESSTSGSSRKSWASRNTGGNAEPGTVPDGRMSASDPAHPEVDGHDASLTPSKHRIRHSGGFLLDSALHASRLPTVMLSRSYKTSSDRIG